MTKTELHNLLVRAFMAGVEKSMEPIPDSVQAAVERGHISVVAAHMSGAAYKYAENIILQPAVAAKLRG